MSRTLPNLGNIRPLAPQVTYPYEERWATSNVLITLACVPWNQYNLPAFTKQEQVDKYINSLPTTRKIDLEVFQNKPPVFSFKCPMPYDVAQEYTYMIVQTQQSAPTTPVPYENTQSPIRKYYYFISDSAYISPNTTELTVNLDVWHTYFDLIEISGADMKRGHLINELAPSPSEYLSNPLAHTKYLTTIDYNFGDPADRVATAEFEQFGGNGARYLVMWGNLEPSQIGNEPANGYHATPVHDKIDPIFNSEGLLINEPWWTYTNDYQTVLPIPHAPNAKGEVPNGIIAFAIELNKAHDFFTELDFRGMMVLNRIQGAAVLPDSMIKRERQIDTAFGKIWLLGHPDIAMTRYVQRDLTADKFDMPDEIKGFTKAYTYPYSHIVFCMPDGTIRNIQVEQLGSGGASYAERLTTAFPWLNGETFLTSFKSDENVQYRFRNMRNGNVNMDMTAGAWQETLTRYEIPIFSLWRTSYTAHRADNYGSIMAAQRSAQISQVNTWHNLDTTHDNTERSIQTNYNNSVDAASMVRTNTNNSANTAYANTLAQTATVKANQVRQNQNNIDNLVASNRYGRQSGELQKQVLGGNYNINKIFGFYEVGTQNSFQKQSTNINNEYLATQAFVNAGSSVTAGALTGGITGGAQGAIIGAVGGATDAILGAVSTGITITKNNAIEDLQEVMNQADYAIKYGAPVNGSTVTIPVRWGGRDSTETIGPGDGINISTVQLSSAKIDGDVSNSITYNTATTTNNNATANDTTDNSVATTNANAARSRDTALTNATNAYNTSVNNATRSRNTANTNNDASFITGVENNVRSYTTAKDNLINEDAQEAMKANRQHTQNGGDAMKDLDGTRGTTIRYAKQTDDALVQVARMWRRYGYSYGSRLPRSLTPATSRANSGQPCTFWQLEELTFTKPIQERYKEYLASIFNTGITFWHKPDFSEAVI